MQFSFPRPSFLSLAVCIIASTGTSALADTPESFKTTLRSFGVDVALTGVRADADSKVEMTVPNYNMGAAVDYDGPLEVNFYLHRATAGEPAEREPERTGADVPDTSNTRPRPGAVTTTPGEDAVLIGSVMLNPAWSETLLVWSRMPGNRFSILALPNDLQNLETNHLRFINTTRRPIALQIRQGESKLLKPGENYTFNSKQSEAIYFWSAMNVGENNIDRISNVVEMRSHIRRTVFITFSNSAATGHDPTGPPGLGFFVITHD